MRGDSSTGEPEPNDDSSNARNPTHTGTNEGWRPDRRSLLRATGAMLGGVALGSTGLDGARAATAATRTTPDLEHFVQPVPRPTVREPDGQRDGADYHEIVLQEFETAVHPDLPATTMWGFDGQFPGPLIQGRIREPIAVEFDNSQLPDDHLLSVDERINGTQPEHYPDYDGPVPEVRTVTHFHGLNVPPEEDGQADMWMSPDGVTGPRFTDSLHELPNEQSRLTSTYHDHALGISRLNIYAGLVGFYNLVGPAEEARDLPTGEYDVPLMLNDRTFADDGSLHYPETFEANVGGDTMLVNGAAWPYLEVEPRRYRLRPVNTSNGRTYNLRLRGETCGCTPIMYQFAAGHGFLDRLVSIGPGCHMDSLLLAPFERADVLVDFSEFAGETLTLTNDAPFPFAGFQDEDHAGGHDEGGDGHGDESGPAIEEVLQIRVAEETSGPDESTPIEDLRMPYSPEVLSPWVQRTQEIRTRQMTLSMVQDEFGLNMHLLNDRRFFDETVHEPELGSVEIWELTNESMHTHPIHLHLVEFDVIGRGPDGTHDPRPNETRGKDTVQVDPDETVRIAVEFRDHLGKYPFHCHVLEHEDHEMMRPFEVVPPGEGDGADGAGGDDADEAAGEEGDGSAGEGGDADASHGDDGTTSASGGLAPWRGGRR